MKRKILKELKFKSAKGEAGTSQVCPFALKHRCGGEGRPAVQHWAGAGGSREETSQESRKDLPKGQTKFTKYKLYLVLKRYLKVALKRAFKIACLFPSQWFLKCSLKVTN